MINTLKKLSEINKIGIGLDYFLFKNLRLLIESKDSVVARKFNILENKEKINKIENLFLEMSLDEQKEAIKIIYIGFLSESFNNDPLDDYGFFDPKFKKILLN